VQSVKLSPYQAHTACAEICSTKFSELLSLQNGIKLGEYAYSCYSYAMWLSKYSI